MTNQSSSPLPGPVLWGVKFVCVLLGADGVSGKGILTNVDVCWKTRSRRCAVEMSNGATVFVSAERLQVLA